MTLLIPERLAELGGHEQEREPLLLNTERFLAATFKVFDDDCPCSLLQHVSAILDRVRVDSVMYKCTNNRKKTTKNIA